MQWVNKVKTIKDKNYSFQHVKERLKERYDLSITMKQYDTLNKTVPLMLKPVTDEGEQLVYRVYFKREFILAVYSKKRELITTVLPYKEV